MIKILYGVSPIGLGHATRAVAIGSKLRGKGVDLEFASGRRAASFIRSQGFKVHDIIDAPVPFEFRGRIRFPTVWYLRYWLGYRSSRSKMLALIRSLRPDVVVGDEEFSGVSIALEKGIKNVLITDELGLNFARSYFAQKIENSIRRWYSDLQKRVSLLIVPDFGEDSGNIRYVTPAVRDITKSRAETLAEHGLPAHQRMVMFSRSGSGLGRVFEDRTVGAFRSSGLDDAYLTLVGSERKAGAGEDIFSLGLVPDNQNLIEAADLIISTAGKSTIDEALSSGKPIIAIPFRDHFEQERNARSLGFAYEDLGRLETLIPEYIGKRAEPRRFRGAENAATLLASLA